MQSDRKQTFAEIMGALGEVFDKQPSEALCAMYFKILSPFPMADVRDAAMKIIATRKYSGFPRPADFLEILQPQRDVESDARIGFKELHDRLRIDGCYENLVFSDPVIVATVRHYGTLAEYDQWTSRMNQREFSFHENDFVKVYRIYANRPDKCVSTVLYGLCATENEQTGYITQRDRTALLPDGKRVEITSEMLGIENEEVKRIEAPDEVDTGLPQTEEHPL